MYFSDLVGRSGRSLKSAKIRTILTALAIAVGGFTLTLTLAAGNGIRNYTDKLVSTNFDPAELIVGRDKEISNTGRPITEPREYDESVSSLDVGAGSGGSLQIKRVTAGDIKELKQQPYTEQVRENYQISTRYITRENQKRYTVGAEVYNPAQKPEVKAGELPDSFDLEPGTVLLPETYLKALAFSNAEDAIGKEIELNVQRPFSVESIKLFIQQTQLDSGSVDPVKPEDKTMKLTIQAVTKKPSTSIAFGGLPVFLSSKDGRELYDFTTQGTPDYEEYIYVNVRVKDGTNEEKLAGAKSDLESKGYYVQSSKDIQKAITQFVNILQIMVSVFAVITLIASVFGIVNTQYISVLERTREIGLMKALGMRRRDVRRLFMLEATWIGFLGGLIGSLLALVVGLPLNPWLTQKLELGASNSLLIFRPVQIALLILGLMLVATLAGLFPARKAAKLDPVEALRTE